MLILAQGHFLLSYLYQYRAGKMNQRYARRYVPFAAFFFGICFFLSVDKLIEGITAAYFVVHFFYDERYLLHEKTDFWGWRITLPTIGILGAEVVYRYAAVRPAWLLPVALGLCSAYMFWVILQGSFRQQSFSRRDGYFLTIFIFATLLTLSGKLLPGPVNFNAINFIILVHFGNWYWSYILKLSSSRALLGKFLLETVVVNSVMGALMLSLLNSSFSVPLSAIAGFFFLRPYFHVWTLLHYVATYRSTDIMNWIPVKNGVFPDSYRSVAK